MDGKDRRGLLVPCRTDGAPCVHHWPQNGTGEEEREGERTPVSYPRLHGQDQDCIILSLPLSLSRATTPAILFRCLLCFLAAAAAAAPDWIATGSVAALLLLGGSAPEVQQFSKWLVNQSKVHR